LNTPFESWQELAGAHLSGGTESSFTDMTLAPGDIRMFYKVREN